MTLPAWLAGDATWAVRVGDGAGGTELQTGDLALIRRGAGLPGKVAAVVREGKMVFVHDARGRTVVGTVTAIVRRLEAPSSSTG
jgi:hypothetical protein